MVLYDTIWCYMILYGAAYYYIVLLKRTQPVYIFFTGCNQFQYKVMLPSFWKVLNNVLNKHVQKGSQSLKAFKIFTENCHTRFILENMMPTSSVNP